MQTMRWKLQRDVETVRLRRVQPGGCKSGSQVCSPHASLQACQLTAGCVTTRTFTLRYIAATAWTALNVAVV